jgi:hypothetical protein
MGWLSAMSPDVRPLRMRLLSVATHIALGFYAGSLTYISFPASVIIIVLFLIYEWVEESKVKDEMYYEVREFLTGYSAGLLFAILSRM